MTRQQDRALRAASNPPAATGGRHLVRHAPAQPPVVPPSNSVDAIALAAFAAELHDTALESKKADSARYRQLQKRESFLFAASATAAILVPILIIVGLILIFALNSHVGGALTSSAGALSAAGSVGLFTLRRQTAKEIRPLEEKTIEDERLYKAVQVAAMIRDPGQQTTVLTNLASDIMRLETGKHIEIDEERSA